MIYLHLTGGIGNMMFIIAKGESWRKEGYDVKYPNMGWWLKRLPKDYEWEQHAEEYRTIFKNFDWRKHDTNNMHELHKICLPFKCVDFKPKDGEYYNGYFQSEKYFYSNEFVKWLFEPSDSAVKRISEYSNVIGTNCSIHVRRGNYLSMQQFHPVLDMGYYNKAIDIMDGYGVDKYIVFSNDMQWCKENFIGDKFVFISDVDYIELFLMAKCKHHILSNSSFALWGAILGENDNTKVIAPKTWFGVAHPPSHADDIVPDRYIKI